ncbi:MAG: hypothetical protein NZ529_02025 [Cytophagaceae bacterium]|nr:hypothetical protein [Cytophagaceae bacterium]MDW8455545.1 hypothetical protein [Cytophagaceae bacterium]
MSTSLKNRLRYWIDNTIVKGTFVLVIAIGIAFLGVALIASLIIFIWGLSEGDGGRLNFAESYWQSLMHVMDQGTITDETGWKFRLIMLPVSIAGILLVSTLVSILNAGFQEKIDELKKGKSIVVEENHTVILGWSSKIFSIISELVEANLNQPKSCIVVLANKDKTEMEDEIKTKVGFFGKTKIICRSGNPIDLDDIKIANLNDSKSIIVLAPEQDRPDTHVIKTIMAIVNNPNRKEGRYNIVAEISNDNNKEIAQLVGGDELTVLINNEVISKIMVQTSRQRHLSIVYDSLLGFKENEFYILDVENSAGYTFEDMLYGFENVCVIGIRTASGELIIAPPLNRVIEENDKLIVLAEDDENLRFVPTELHIEDVSLSKSSLSETRLELHNTLILGWNSNAHIIIKESDNYVMRGSELMVIAESEELEDKLNHLKYQLSNQTIKYVKGDINDRALLEKIDFNKFRHIILLSYSDDYSMQEADAITLIALMHLRDIIQKNKLTTKVSLVTEILDMKNRALANLNKADDFIISDRIISLLLAQISENKELALLFDDLFDADGKEIYLKSCTHYFNAPAFINFYSVIQACIQKNEIAIGYMLSEHANDPEQNYGIVLNPPKSQRIQFVEGDKIIVIAEN